MAEEFKAVTISSQEEMDNLFKERLAREAKKYDGYMSPDGVKSLKDGYEAQIKKLTEDAAAEKAKYAGFDKQIQERDAKIAKYESDSVKTRIAVEAGLDPSFAGRLQGSNEEDWKKDAQILAKSFAAARVAPLANPESGDGKPAARDKFAEWLKESLGN